MCSGPRSRQAEAEAFYATVTRVTLTKDEAQAMRQAPCAYGMSYWDNQSALISLGSVAISALTTSTTVPCSVASAMREAF